MTSAASQPGPRAACVLVAAGQATRMRAGPGAPRKPWLELGGRTVLEHACAAFDAVASVIELVLVVHPEDVERLDAWRRDRPGLGKVRAVLAGGAERADSVRLGCRAASADVDVLAIHDAARPLVEPALVARAIERAHAEGAALLAARVSDTLKRSEDGAHALETVDRRSLWAAQTPQCFRARRFEELLARAEAEGFRPTDDASLWERWVGPVALIESPTSNLKITRPEDLPLAEAVLRARTQGAS